MGLKNHFFANIEKMGFSQAGVWYDPNALSKRGKALCTHCKQAVEVIVADIDSKYGNPHYALLKVCEQHAIQCHDYKLPILPSKETLAVPPQYGPPAPNNFKQAMATAKVISDEMKKLVGKTKQGMMEANEQWLEKLFKAADDGEAGLEWKSWKTKHQQTVDEYFKWKLPQMGASEGMFKQEYKGYKGNPLKMMVDAVPKQPKPAPPPPPKTPEEAQARLFAAMGLDTAVGDT